MKRILALATTLALAAAATAAAPDWHQWQGPNRDAKCTETGLLQSWPDGGPPLLWKLEGLGVGYSTLSFANGKFFTMGDLRQGGSKDQYVMAYDLDSRKRLWATRVGPPHKDGSRCTPTIDGDRAYAVGTSGDLVCCKTDTGKVLWRKNFGKDFGGKMMSGWKYSESPLVDGQKLICTPGGRQATMVALNKMTGDLIWKCAVPDPGGKGRYGAGYSSAVISEAAGVRQYVQLFGKGLFAADAETGKFLWSYSRVANRVANITTPIVHGDYVFGSTEYNTGSCLLKIEKDGDGLAAKEVWWLGHNQFQNHHGGVILVDGYLYGGTNKNGGPPTCIELETGEIQWQVKPPSRGSAAYLYADGHFIVRYDTGVLTLIEANPEKYVEKGAFRAPRGAGPAWPHPVIRDGRLYLRHRDLLLCYDLRK
jgi:outer membrane protein assembly factor BamB